MQNYTTLIMIALMVAAFYFLILRPQKRRQQALQATLSSLSPGNRVLLGSGLFGTIVSIGDRQAVLEISPGVELTVLKQAIVRTVTDADEDTDDVEERLDDEDDVEPGTASSHDLDQSRDSEQVLTDPTTSSTAIDPKRIG